MNTNKDEGMANTILGRRKKRLINATPEALMRENEELRARISSLENEALTPLALVGLLVSLARFNDHGAHLVASGGLFIRGFCSYRGDYAQLALIPCADESEALTVAELLSSLMSSLVEDLKNYIYGWKGGSYLIHKDMEVYLSKPREVTGLQVCGLKNSPRGCVIVTKAE